MTGLAPTHPIHWLLECALVWERAHRENARQMEAAPKAEIDQATLAMAKNGDPDAYARVIRHYQAGVAKRMARFTRSGQAVEELTQDVFVQAYLSLAGFAGAAPFSHWLNRIATRVGLKHWEDQKRLPTQATDLAWAGMADKPATDRAGAARDALDIVLAKLEPVDRMVIVLMHLDGKTAKEAADLMGRSVTMTKVQAFRARIRLKKIIEDSPELSRLIQEALS
jgi:RNA polymerase sigma-70 factor, ECF subfamily